MEHDLQIVPVINKIDLSHARTDEVIEEMEQSLAVEPEEVMLASRQEWDRYSRTFDVIVDRIPPPDGDPAAGLQAMVFDSHHDRFRGAITYVRIMNGSIQKGEDQVQRRHDP